MSESTIGSYELRGELGRGAMARVWRAWDPHLEREVAIKEPLFDPNLTQSALAEMGRRFVAEGRAAARLNHPNIVSIYAADVWDGRPAIVMELVNGTTLSALLTAGPLSPTSTLSILDQLLDAVGYAHSCGVVHRDIKPDNVFVTANGAVKLADFGIAHMDGSMTHATVAGAVLGTPGYMSPEQARGTTVDGRSDLFSVGVIAYEMLTGRNPFGAGYGTDSTTLIYRIVHEPAPELPDDVSAGLPADLRPAIMAALSKDPADRPQTADEFKAMLHGMLAVPAPREAYPRTVVDDPNSFPASPSRSTGGFAGTGATTSVQTQQRGGKPGGLPGWLPYAVVAGVGVIAIAIALASASTGVGGGGGRAAVAPAATSTASAGYLSVSDGYVALFTSTSAEPYEVSDVAIADLSPQDAAELGAHVPVSSLEEAEQLIDDYERKAAETQKEREEAEKQQEQLEATPTETIAAEPQEPAQDVVTVTITGADGTSRTESIRREGSSERVFADSNSRLLSESEVDALSDAERCIAWNEIVAASNGYAFKNSGLASYFAGCSWYHKNSGADAGGNLSGNAAKNVQLLQSHTSSWWKNLATN